MNVLLCEECQCPSEQFSTLLCFVCLGYDFVCGCVCSSVVTMWVCMHLFLCLTEHCLCWENYSAIIRPHIVPSHCCTQMFLFFGVFFLVLIDVWAYIYFLLVEVSTFLKKINMDFNKYCIGCMCAVFFAHTENEKCIFRLNWKCCISLY